MSEKNGKRIELVKMRVGDLKLEMPNPRKIKKKKREELERSLEKIKKIKRGIDNKEI